MPYLPETIPKYKTITPRYDRPHREDDIMTFKDKAETVQAIVTIIAILVGGFWTYNLFIKERKHFPHANIEHKVSHVVLPDQINLLRVGVMITNAGSSRLLSNKSVIRVQQILPVPSCPEQGACAKEEIKNALKKVEREKNRFTWPLIAERTQIREKVLDIEPGEKQLIEYEFAVNAAIKVVRIYSYFRNDQRLNSETEIGWIYSYFRNDQRSNSKTEIGWTISGYYDFRKSKLDVSIN